MGKKSKRDKFYTKYKSVEICLNKIDLSRYDKVIEPSAGNGAFSKKIKKVIAMDISPEDESIKKMDWFKYQDDLSDSIVIGNPPFGERNKLSKEFIKHAVALKAQAIAFILPNVYKKHTLQKVFPKDYRLKKIVELPKNSFTLENKDYDVPCSFFIWDKSKGKDLRFDISRYKTNDWNFVYPSKKEMADFFILGASPNTVKKIEDVDENNRGYYIKSKSKKREELVDIFRNIEFNGHASCNGGVSWLTKAEIIKNYIEREYKNEKNN